VLLRTGLVRSACRRDTLSIGIIKRIRSVIVGILLVGVRVRRRLGVRRKSILRLVVQRLLIGWRSVIVLDSIVYRMIESLWRRRLTYLRIVQGRVILDRIIQEFPL